VLLTIQTVVELSYVYELEWQLLVSKPLLHCEKVLRESGGEY
jgi:hypothetical protein